jgi:hypothetical protein
LCIRRKEKLRGGVRRDRKPREIQMGDSCKRMREEREIELGPA